VGDALTCDAVLALALHLQRLHVDALVGDEAGAGDAAVWLAESFLQRPEEEDQFFFKHLERKRENEEGSCRR